MSSDVIAWIVTESTMETAAPGLHDAILLCVGIAGVYLVVAGMQLAQLRRRLPAKPAVLEPTVGGKPPKAQEGATATDTPSFAKQFAYSNVEADLKRLRRELHHMQIEFKVMQGEIDQLRSERTTVNVAPQYNEAMVFARQGIDVAGIAARCDISRSEAELVASLARKLKIEPQMDKTTSLDPIKESNERQRYRVAA